MKKNIWNRLLTVTTWLFVLPVLFASCEKTTVLDSVPAEIRSYVTAHFPANTILQTVKNVDGTEITYDVILSESIFLEFNRKKEITEIDATTALPDDVIPDNILNYVNINYPDNFIIGWELKDKKNQQIDLNNGLELLFDKSGNFIRLDN